MSKKAMHIANVRNACAALLVACMAALALFWAGPACAWASEGLTVTQAFKTSGYVPPSVTGAFDYELSAQGDAPLPKGSAGSYSFSLTGNASLQMPVAFSASDEQAALVFSHAGVFEYDLKCTATSDNPNMVIDTTAYHVFIVIKNAASGSGLELKEIIVKNSTTGDKYGEAAYTHVYHGSSRVVVGADPPVKKSINGDAPSKDATFRFLFKPDNDANPMPKGSNGGKKTITVKGEGTKEVGQITFRAPGTYSYTVTEVDTNVDGYTYDGTEYRITFTITEDELGDLYCATSYTKDGKAVDSLESFAFTNTYDGGKVDPGESIIDKLVPKTGDAVWGLLVVCILVAIIAAVFLVITAKRRRDDRDDRDAN